MSDGISSLVKLFANKASLFSVDWYLVGFFIFRGKFAENSQNFAKRHLFDVNKVYIVFL